MKGLGARLRSLREEKGMTQKQVGDLVGLTYHSVLCWEKEKAEPSAEMIVKLCEIFNCTSDFLLGIKEF